MWSASRGLGPPEVHWLLVNNGATIPAARKGCTRETIVHRTSQQEGPDSARTFAALRRVRRWLTWTVREDNGLYAVSLSGPRDVAELLSLEMEFIADHRELIGPIAPGISDVDLHEELGLDPDPETRRATIDSISRYRKSHVVGERKGFTIKCVHLPHSEGSGAKPEVVGYLYFKLCDNTDREEGDSKEQAIERSPGTSKRSTEASQQWAMVVSHLKVARQHQGRGVATLLLSGMLRHLELMTQEVEPKSASACAPGFSMAHQRLELSVIKVNEPAVRLYSRLGFLEVSRHGDPIEFLQLRLDTKDPTPGHLLARWLALIPGGGASGSNPKTPLVCPSRQKKRPAPSPPPLLDKPRTARRMEPLAQEHAEAVPLGRNTSEH